MLADIATADPTAELRGWITLGWALIVGSATFAGVVVAVRNYLHTTWQTKVAVARLVWAEERGPRFVPHAGSRLHVKHNAESAIPIPETSGRISVPDLFEAGRVQGSVTTVWKVEGRRSFARITNNSREPVGNVSLVLHRGKKPPAEAQDRSDMPRTLLPETDMLIEVDLPRDGNPFSSGVLVLRFSDSAGTRWERRGTRPPKLVPERRPRRFARLGAWWFRRKLEVRRALQWKAKQDST